MPHPDASTEAFHEALPDDFTTLGITRFTQRVAVETQKKLAKHSQMPARSVRCILPSLIAKKFLVNRLARAAREGSGFTTP